MENSILVENKLECIDIDLKLISTLLEININNDSNNIYLSDTILMEVNNKLEKYYWDNNNSGVDMLFLIQQCINLFIANNKLEFKEKIMKKSGYYDYYGVDGNYDSVPYVYVSARYSNFDTFKSMLTKFSNESFKESHCDNIYIQNKPFPDSLIDSLIKCEKINYEFINKYVSLNNTPFSKRNGNVINCDLLIELAKENKNKSIYENLIQFKNYKFFSIFWFYEDDKDEYGKKYINDGIVINYEELNNFLNVGYNGFIVALPKIEEYKSPNNYNIYNKILSKLINSEIVKIGDIKIYKI